MKKNKMSNILNEWLPPPIVQRCRNILVKLRFLRFPYSKLIKNNLQFKGSARGKKIAFLLATGPSINKENLHLLQGRDVFSVSNFFLHDLINELKPKLHFFAPYHEPLVFENYVKWLQEADKKLPPGTNIVLGQAAVEMVKEFNLFSKRKVFYLYLDNVQIKNRIDLTKPISGAQTIPLMVIPVLLYMGYEKIYLLGCDHDMLKDYNSNVENFYEPEKEMRINPFVLPNIIDSHRDSLGVFLQYYQYKQLLEKKYDNKVKIINLSQSSWLDFFSKDSLDKIKLFL